MKLKFHLFTRVQGWHHTGHGNSCLIN